MANTRNMLNTQNVQGVPEKSRHPIAVSDISFYICLIDIRGKSKEQLNERRAGLSTKKCPRKKTKHFREVVKNVLADFAR